MYIYFINIKDINNILFLLIIYLYTVSKKYITFKRYKS